MFTVALIGGDGAGKTTIAKSLEQSSQLPLKYLYMGLSTQSSNFALPTSRLVLFLKRRSYRKMVQKSDDTPPETIPANYLEYEEAKRSPIWVTARFLNRLAEAWYRQAVSLSYRMRGYVILYDRHFLFDTVPEVVNAQLQKQPWLDRFYDRVYYWSLSHCYPKPDLAIFLDAPAEVLYQRKGEATPDYLNRQRGAFLEQGKKVNHFVRVDATQPLEKVLKDVTEHILEFNASKHH